MLITEIFNSIEGEGKRIGLPSTFIRLYGCNLRCSYCDSLYSVDSNIYVKMSIDEIIKVVDSFNCPNVTVTGGEPLIQKDCNLLLDELTYRGYKVNVETNGSIKPTFRHPNLFYTVDYKTNTSGVTNKMDSSIFTKLLHTDVIKFVVGSIDDLVQAKEYIDSINTEAVIYVSPIFSMIEPVEIVNFIKDNELWDWHMQLQLHKYIWNPNERGV